MTKVIAVGLWLGVLVLVGNAWIAFQVLTELRGEDRPLEVSVDWENQRLIKVDIAQVSNLKQEGLSSGYIPVWTPVLTNADTGQAEALKIPTTARVENTVSVSGLVSVDTGFTGLDVNVLNWP